MPGPVQPTMIFTGRDSYLECSRPRIKNEGLSNKQQKRLCCKYVASARWLSAEFVHKADDPQVSSDYAVFGTLVGVDAGSGRLADRLLSLQEECDARWLQYEVVET